MQAERGREAFGTDHDCLLGSDEEAALESLFAVLDQTDVSIGGVAGVSVGIGVRAVPATF